MIFSVNQFFTNDIEQEYLNHLNDSEGNEDSDKDSDSDTDNTFEQRQTLHYLPHEIRRFNIFYNKEV